MKKHAIVAIVILLFIVVEPVVLPAQAAQATTLIVQVPPTVHIGSWVNLSARLTLTNGNPIEGGWITWYVDGQESAAGLTDSTGYARMALGNLHLSTGTHTVSAVSNATSAYASAQAQAAMTVLEASTTTQTSQTTTLPSSTGGNQVGSAPSAGLSEDALAQSIAIVIAGVCVGLGVFFGSRTKRQTV
ncbi:MAG TPA: hypothetical protein VGS11_10625 [Candidatus Bathyarchaeia archaeon]|nr:hypothetical protein [Candidatus Bathyarchaeia archaeon]